MDQQQRALIQFMRRFYSEPEYALLAQADPDHVLADTQLDQNGQQIIRDFLRNPAKFTEPPTSKT